MYDVLMLIFDTINKAGTLDADKLVEAFEKANYQGVYGRRVFTKSHNVVIGAEYITPSGTQFIDGKFYTIYPPAAAETTFKIPPTIKGS
jgi:branched-chain amino acid transport system substrate-binding protein